MVEEIENIELIKKYLEFKGELKNYVYLREDENGRYIEYAFTDGVPEHNRCLSWYCKPHPKTWAKESKDNKEEIEFNMSRLLPVNKIYQLFKLNCGDKECKIGHPKEECIGRFMCRKDWSEEEPVKCACWDLFEVDFTEFGCSFKTIQEYIDFANFLKQK